MTEISFIKTKKTVSQTLSELRHHFKQQGINDWEPIPAATGVGYAVRYLRGGNWTEIGSTLQPTKAMNLRVCFQVIDNMFRWEARGVSGLIKGTAFMGGALVTTRGNAKESFEEACAIIGVEPETSWEEIKNVYRVKIAYAHPDKGGDPERFKRIHKAFEYLEKVKGGK